MNKIFVHTNEIFDSDLLVCIGATIHQISGWVNKNGSKEIKSVFRDRNIKAELDDHIKNHTYFLYKVKYNGLNYFILYMKNFKSDWKSVDSLNHELIHYRDFLFKIHTIKHEMEFEAYFQESMFRVLRRKLFKFLKKKKKR